MAIGSKISELKEKASKKLSSAKELARAKLPMGKSEIKEITKKAEEIASAINEISNRLNQNKNVVVRLRKRFENETIIRKYLKSDAGKSKGGITTAFLKKFNERLNDFIEKLDEYQKQRDKLEDTKLNVTNDEGWYNFFKQRMELIKEGCKLSVKDIMQFESGINVLGTRTGIEDFKTLRRTLLDATRCKNLLHDWCVNEVKKLKKYKNKIVNPTICYESVIQAIEDFKKTLRNFPVGVVN